MRIAPIIFFLLFHLSAFPLSVREADKGYTLGIEGMAFRARINKKFPSFLGVLHDAGCPADPFIGYFYGWWTSSDFPVEGKGWVGLHMPIYRLVDLKIQRGKGKTLVKTEVCLKDDPLVRIRSIYTFEDDVPGFEMEREFIGSERRRFGPLGFWLGGTLSEFPISNAVPPDSYFYEGSWHYKIEHSWTDLGSLNGGPKNGETFVVLYWSESKRYLIMAIVPEGFGGGLKALNLVWRGNWKEPCWGQNAGLFSYAKFRARFLLGTGSREEAVRKGRELIKGRWERLRVLRTKEERERGIIRYIENGYYKLGIDVRRAEVVSLKVDVKGQGRWSEDLLSGKNSKIYFGGPSDWQRSIYPEEQYTLLLKPLTLKPARISPYSINFPDLLLLSPEGLPLIKASVDFSIKDNAIALTAEFQGLKNVSLPYLGWHLDFPFGSWERFYNSAGGYSHRRMLENYKMGIYDLQPCYRPIGGDLIAYGDELSSPIFRSLCLRINDGGSNVPFLVNLPNPLFDRATGISKIAITPCAFDWTQHNCRPMSLEKGKTYKLSAFIRLTPTVPPPSQGTFKINLPFAPDVEKALDMFLIEHCMGGPFAPDGMIPFFWTLAGKYNPRFNLDAMRANLELYLSAIADGKNTRDEVGNILPRGMLPIAYMGEGKWLWRWNQTGYIFETNAQFILSAFQYVILSNDIDFLKKNFPRLEEAFYFYRSLADENEVLKLPPPYTGLIDQGRPSTYWDGWCIGHRYSLLQVYYSASAFALSRLAYFLNEEEKAREYQEIGEKARKSLLSLYWREDNLRDNKGSRLKGGRFISWIDVNGKEIDVGFTDIPLLAYYLGILPEEKAEKVIQWLDCDPNAYSWKDERTGKAVGIPAINTIDGNKEAFYAGIWNNFQRAPGVENGQTQFWQGGFDWYMRARLSPEDVWEKIKAFAKRVLRGDLASGHGLPYTRPLPPYEGTNAFSADDKPVGSDQGLMEDAILITVGIIEGIAGLRIDEDKIYFQPAIPKEMANISLESVRCGDKVINIKYRGYGKLIKEVRLNGKVTSYPISRRILKDGDSIEVIMGSE